MMNSGNSSSIFIEKPSPYARFLVEHFLPFSQSKQYPPRIRLSLHHKGEALCLLILEGLITVHRETDGLAVATLPAPQVLGLGRLDIYIETLQPCKIAMLSVNDAHKVIKDNNLWENVAHYLLLASARLYTHGKQLSAPTAYEIICHQLRELLQEPNEIRTNKTAEQYIREKTHLSRSRIMKILSELKTGEYIVLHRGHLLEINHLPLRY